MILYYISATQPKTAFPLSHMVVATCIVLSDFYKTKKILFCF